MPKESEYRNVMDPDVVSQRQAILLFKTEDMVCSQAIQIRQHNINTTATFISSVSIGSTVSVNSEQHAGKGSAT